jgi:hypothetical protein
MFTYSLPTPELCVIVAAISATASHTLMIEVSTRVKRWLSAFSRRPDDAERREPKTLATYAGNGKRTRISNAR